MYTDSRETSRQNEGEKMAFLGLKSPNDNKHRTILGLAEDKKGLTTGSL